MLTSWLQGSSKVNCIQTRRSRIYGLIPIPRMKGGFFLRTKPLPEASVSSPKNRSYPKMTVVSQASILHCYASFREVPGSLNSHYPIWIMDTRAPWNLTYRYPKISRDTIPKTHGFLCLFWHPPQGAVLPFGPDGHSNVYSAPGTILWTKTGSSPTVLRVATVDGASVLLTLDTEAPVLVGQRHLGYPPDVAGFRGEKGEGTQCQDL